jgi:sugar lactone lactonase YvrE
MHEGKDKRRTGGLSRLDPDLSLHAMETGIGTSNSIAWSPDDRTFYYSDTAARVIWAYDFDLDAGTIANRRVLTDMDGQPGGPDGSTVDAEGFLWNAQWGGWRLVRYAPDGRVDRVVPMPVAQPTSCMFGGEDLATLYVTSARTGLSDADLARQPQAGGLFALDVGVRGLPEPRFAG